MNGKRYDAIINMQRPVSKKHHPMPIKDRAAQFASFAALNGYEDEIDETARYTDSKAELSDDEKSEISEKLRFINENINSRPNAVISFFRSDELKEGGHYLTVSGQVNEINELSREVVMTDGTRIAIDDIMMIEML